MRCGRVDEVIEFYIERQLDPATYAEVDEHIKSCAECSRKVEAAKKSLGLLRDALGSVAPGREFDEKITRRVINLPLPSPTAATHAGAGDRNAAGTIETAERRRLALLAIGAAIIFLIALLVVIWSFSPNG